MSDNAVASPSAAAEHDVLAELTAPVPEVGDGGPELVQLLTPEGERVEHPEYDHYVGPDRRGAARLLPRHGPDPPHRRRGHRPAAPGRARASGPSCSARRPRRSAPAARCARRTTSSRPTASTASPGAAASTRSSCSACSAASTTAAGTRTRTTSTSTRSSSAPRPCTPPATPWACSATATSAPATPTATPPSSPTSATAPPARATSTRRSSSPRLQRAGRVLLPEQPVGDLRADRAADPDPALPARAAASASPASGSTATTCSPSYAVTQRRAASAPATARARRSSRRTPTGWARTPPPTTRPGTALSDERRGAGSSRTRSSGCKAYLRTQRAGRRRPSSTRVDAEADELGAPTCARAAWRMPDPDAAERCSTTSTPRSTA